MQKHRADKHRKRRKRDNAQHRNIKHKGLHIIQRDQSATDADLDGHLPRKLQKMTITYSCISRGNTILCSHQIGEGNFENVVTSMLPNMPTRNDGKTTYKSDNYLFHCVIENGMIYMCAANPDFAKRQAYAFLAEIKRKFQSGTLAMQAVSAGPHEMDSEFSFVFSQNMEKFSKPGAGDNVSALRSQVDEVKDVMTQNIERVLERGERLENLIDKTEELESSAATFQKTAKRIQRKYWWSNLKMKIILGVVVFVILVIVVVLILYGAHVFEGKTTPSPPAVTSTASPVG
ncbi:hypothetical protein FSP39_014088 [Pinctada imbricata]|uniref:Vesicle-associated membrane protein 7 n=1 Tax=Pinctada imbricata TaxID=66713 RepID=A0AA88Y780_PINIB|nr:hypothetical protein FSP39_014088 [Pinctada imbricata]